MQFAFLTILGVSFCANITIEILSLRVRITIFSSTVGDGALDVPSKI